MFKKLLDLFSGVTKIKIKKNYQRKDFFRRIKFNFFFWTAFAAIFYLVGSYSIEQKHSNLRFLGIGKRADFFIGRTRDDKLNSLNYSLLFLILINVCNLISTIMNFFSWERSEYFINNEFYDHHKELFSINALSQFLFLCFVTNSFFSYQTFLVSLVFFVLHNILSYHLKKEEEIKFDNFYPFKDANILGVFFWSSVIVFILPFCFDSIRIFITSFLDNSPGDFPQIINSFISSNKTLENFLGLILKKDPNLEALHWIFLLYYAWRHVNDKVEVFNEFWESVASYSERADDIKNFFQYQKKYSEKKGEEIDLGDYGYIKSVPNFLNDGSLGIETFEENNFKLIECIISIESELTNKTEQDYMKYFLFKRINSIKELNGNFLRKKINCSKV